MADDIFAQIPVLLDKGGMPALAGVILTALFVKFGRKESPDTQLATAMKELTDEVRTMRLEMTDRFARIESDVKHLEGRK
jgi:uncharacterized membrane-anchored protein YhcB (DUF1043 family)